MPRRTIPMSAADITGRRNSDGLEWTLRNVDPNTRTKITGVSSIIFVSGARVNERNDARAIAEACSEIQGIRPSRNDALALRFCRICPGSRCGFRDLKCPVYNCKVVPYDRLKLA